MVRHRELEKVDVDLLRADGVHLNAIGLDIWTLNLKEGIESAIGLWRDGRS